MADQWDGKVVLVTGGSSGIGLAAAERFAAAGARVFITGRKEAALAAAVEKIGHGAAAVPGDIADLPDLRRLYASVKERAGRIDVLFANAGVAERND